MSGFLRCVLYLLVLALLAHPLGQALPRRWFDPYQAPYRCRDWEQGGRVYNKLHIRRWKDRLPDMSRLMPDMVKKKLAAADPMSLVQETCVAEAVHTASSLLGLVCDPIAGLVEVPCIKRNASGAMVAMCCADMALAGIRSAVPPDEVIMAMKDVGDKMDVSLREMGLGGIAGTPSGVKIADELRLAYGHLNG